MDEIKDTIKLLRRLKIRLQVGVLELEEELRRNHEIKDRLMLECRMKHKKSLINLYEKSLKKLNAI